MRSEISSAFSFLVGGILLVAYGQQRPVLGARAAGTRHDDLTLFSGVYNPNMKYSTEIYAGAYLVPKKLFMKKRALLESLTSLEQSVSSVIMEPPHHGQSSVTHVMMTRDYFDCMVEHLSAYTNQLEGGRANEILLRNATAKAEHLRRNRARPPPGLSGTQIDPFKDVVITLIPFATKAAKFGSDDMTTKMRIAFFLQTFWSIQRYFPNIVVSVSKAHDLKILNSLNLPLFDIFASTLNDDEKANYAANVKQALVRAHENFKSNATWSQFQYMYYSEADLVLHLRSQRELFDIMESTRNSPDTERQFVLSPHRMQCNAHVAEFSDNLRNNMAAWQQKAVQNSKLITKRSVGGVLRGSCCDDGRWIFRDCGNWWYNCQEWGLKNMTTWIRIGPEGFAMPLTTEHLGRCQHHPNRVKCPVPAECKNPVPANIKELCFELDKVN